MTDEQDLAVVKSATVRVTHAHAFGGPGGLCRCGKTEAETDGPVQVTEATGNA